MNRPDGSLCRPRPLAPLVLAALLAACDGRPTDPRSQTVARLDITFTRSTAAGPSAAFGKADALAVRLTSGQTAVADTVFGFAPDGSVRVELELAESELSADLEIEVRRAADALFRGTAAAVVLRRGDVATAAVPLDAVVSDLRLADEPTVITAIGDTVPPLGGAVFATGDVIPDVPLTWSSTDPAVATVETDGRVIARGEGQARVHAEWEAWRDSADVEVAAAVTSITVAPPSAQLAYGATQQFDGVARDRRGTELDRTLLWSSTNAFVASVDQAGLVTAHSVGTVTIEAGLEDSGTTRGSATVTVQPRFADGDWTTLAPMPMARTEVTAATDGRLVYVIGGFAATGGAFAAPRAMYVYDPAADAWTTSPDSIPQGVNHAGFAHLDGRLYILGGFREATFTPTAAVRVYDIAAGEWTDGPPLPTPRGALSVAVLDGKIHAIGGNAANAAALDPAEHNVGPDGSSVGTHEVFDPATGQWTRLAPMPTARNHAGAAVADGRIHVVAGRVGNNATMTVHEVYDPAAGAWSAAAPVPTGRSGIAVVELGGRVYVFGGETFGAEEKTFDEAERYDPFARHWESLPRMPTARHGLGAAVVGGAIYVIAGGPRPGFTFSDVAERLVP